MKIQSSLSRRDLLTSAAALMPVAQTAGAQAVKASDRITVGAIGAGPRGMYVLSEFLKDKDIRVVAVCDCFADRRAAAKQAVDAHYGGIGCASYRFHEQILERDDIDAVLIATGDRWHSVLSVLAARAGKDVYCEKPMSLTIAEGRTMANAMKRYGTIWQCGTQRKSIPGYAFVREIVRSGRIGKLHTITTSFGDGSWRNDALPVPEPAPDPEVFDYDRWLGQAPWAPYSPVGVRMWRLNWDTSAGPVADMGPHYFEFTQWVRGDELSGPVEFEGEGEFRRDPKFNNIPFWLNVRARYADGMRLNMDSGPKGVRFDGDEGWIQLVDEGGVAADPKSVLAGLKAPEGNWKVMAPHIHNFVEAVRSRKQPVSPPEVAQRAHTVCHAANLMLRLRRPLRWDPAAELFIGDDEANNMLSRSMRSPWTI